MIRAISFDLWDTIVVDDSDELERSALGLLSKHDERRALLHAAVPHRALSDVVAACDEVDTAFRYAWKVEHTNWTVDARLRRVFERLGEQPSEAAFQEAVEGWETMELLHSPRLIDGAAEAIAALASRYPLAICSDAIVSPGRVLRQLLEKHGVKQYFSSFAFSDEVGASKPAAAGFAAITKAFGVPGAEIAHVGDRQETDVEGIQRYGGIAVMYTGAIDRHKGDTTAEVTCSDYRTFIDQLSAIGMLP